MRYALALMLMACDSVNLCDESWRRDSYTPSAIAFAPYWSWAGITGTTTETHDAWELLLCEYTAATVTVGDDVYRGKLMLPSVYDNAQAPFFDGKTAAGRSVQVTYLGDR